MVISFLATNEPPYTKIKNKFSIKIVIMTGSIPASILTDLADKFFTSVFKLPIRVASVFSAV